MSEKSYSKLFGCNIHGSIRISPIALKIIDTPEFQRMRDIKQLGLCYQIYPAATHTRFEHSIGVYHLAGRMIEKIQQQYPNKEYDIPNIGKTKLTPIIGECIKLAGLCHDIGHGPFSHIFDDILLQNSTHPNKHHEVRSCLILEMLCHRELSDELNDQHIKFIKSLINPSKHHVGALYQIISNDLNGVDVDKFDYLTRDSTNLGLSDGFHFDRLINEFIIDENNNIAYPKHCSVDIYEMFHKRYLMHKKVYNHKTVKIIECMLSDIYIKIDSIFKISESIKNMNTFCKLNDSTIFNYLAIIMNPPIFLKINLSEGQLDDLNKAHQIYDRIISRKLYQQITKITEIPEKMVKVETYLNSFLKMMLNKYPEHFTLNDFCIVKIKIGFINENKPDPFSNVFFYNKKEDTHTFNIKKTEISGIINSNNQEIHVQLILKKKEFYYLTIQEFENYPKYQ